jgi:hypothetical protein
MKGIKKIWLFLLILTSFLGLNAQKTSTVYFEFLGDSIKFDYNSLPITRPAAALSPEEVLKFISTLELSDYRDMKTSLLNYRDKNKLDDWLFYQMVRKTAQQLSPKAENYFSYTLYKWFILTRCGYDARIRISENKMLFYVQSDEVIYNIPFRVINDKQYICLNYHDYGSNIDFEKESFSDVALKEMPEMKPFSYKVTHLPDIKSDGYVDKEIQFNYNEKLYHFMVKLNPQVKNLFVNYPAAEYSNHFNIPLSRETYNSLIPQLKEIIQPMSTTSGIDYLMRFTRYSFLYQKDQEIFGKEKRLSPEETLLYEKSDCEDRAALFFYLVKEIYNLPMIVLAYPNHVTVAVKLEKPVGKPIFYNGSAYYVCEPTPQKKDLLLGQLLPQLKKENFEVAYSYNPQK